MTDLDPYSVITAAVRIATTGDCHFPQRIQQILRLASRACGASAACFYLADTPCRTLELCSTDTFPDGTLPARIPFGEGICGRCASSVAPVRLPASAAHQEERVRTGSAELYALPIVFSRRLHGVLSLELGSGADLDLSMHRLLDDLLAVLRGVVAAYADSQATRGWVRSVAALNDFGKKLDPSLPPAKLIPQILKKSHAVAEADCTVLRIFPNRHGIPPAVRSTIERRSRCALPLLLEIEAEASRRVGDSGRSVFTGASPTGEKYAVPLAAIPLLVENRVIGTITFFGNRFEEDPACGSDKDRELFNSIAMISTNALLNATHLRKMLALHDENNRKLKEMALLNQLSNYLLSTTRLNKMVSVVLTALTWGENPFFDRAMLFLINEKAGNMQGMLGVTCENSLNSSRSGPGDDPAFRWDLDDAEVQRLQDTPFGRKVQGARIPLDRHANVCSCAVHEKRVIHVSDASRRKKIDHDFLARFGITSFAAAPLLSKERVLGVVIVDNSLSRRPIKSDELRCLQLITNQAGVAIESSMLYKLLEEANRDLREAQERIMQGEKLAVIGEMAARIVHELKSPLVSIGGFGRRLVKRLSNGSADWAAADTIVKETQRLENMLSEVLTYAKKPSICYAPCDIRQVLESSLALVAASLEEKRISLHRDLPGQLPLFMGDAQQLKQVFLNLFHNAEEAMKSGGTLYVSVETGRFNSVHSLLVTVADTGGGMPAEAVHQIFNPFFTTKHHGTGLGLPIVHRIVTNHRGKIEVRNHPGVGAEFRVILPVAQ